VHVGRYGKQGEETLVANIAVTRTVGGYVTVPTRGKVESAEIFYKDWGSGQPVVFSHGWPLNADAWTTS